MNKAILISIQPQHAVNILNGDKTLELRKTVPKDFKGWVYIYCTKGGGLLVDNTTWINYLIRKGLVEKDYTESPRFHTLKKLEHLNMTRSVRNTKVVARFWVDETYYIKQAVNVYGDELNQISIYDNKSYGWKVPKEQQEILKQLCLTEQEVLDYVKGKELYAWHIKELEIFDKPLSLNDFYKATLYASGEVVKEYEKQTNDLTSYRLQKAPQSWQYVYVEERK